MVGAPLQKSFKDRAMDLPPISSRHSIDTYMEDEEFDKPEMVATGIPDRNNPIPEIGYGGEDDVSEVGTSKPYIEGRIKEESHGNLDNWPNRKTPEQPQIDTAAATRPQTEDRKLKEAETAVVGAQA